MMKPIRQLREERGKSEFQLADILSTTPQDIHDLEQGIASPSVERSRVLTENNTPMPARATSSTSARSWTVSCRVSASETRSSAVTNAPRIRRPASRQRTMTKRPTWVRAAIAAVKFGSTSTTLDGRTPCSTAESRAVTTGGGTT